MDVGVLAPLTADNYQAKFETEVISVRIFLILVASVAIACSNSDAPLPLVSMQAPATCDPSAAPKVISFDIWLDTDNDSIIRAEWSACVSDSAYSAFLLIDRPPNRCSALSVLMLADVDSTSKPLHIFSLRFNWLKQFSISETDLIFRSFIEMRNPQTGLVDLLATPCDTLSVGLK